MNGGMELYLHMPFCVRKCAYCDFLSFPTDQETQNLYTRRLREDIDAMGKKYGDIPVDTIFIGGGTPSVPDSALIVGIMEHVRKAFHVAEGAEISMEPWNRDKGETHRLQAGRDQSPELWTPISK